MVDVKLALEELKEEPDSGKLEAAWRDGPHAVDPGYGADD
jgi:hypothetical protein